MLFVHVGLLDPAPSRPHRARPFSFRGWGLVEGVLVLEGTTYLLEWDATERGWLLAKQGGDEIYCTRPDSCTCSGHNRWGTACKHMQTLVELLREWRIQKDSTSQLTGVEEGVE